MLPTYAVGNQLELDILPLGCRRTALIRNPGVLPSSQLPSSDESVEGARSTDGLGSGMSDGDAGKGAESGGEGAESGGEGAGSGGEGEGSVGESGIVNTAVTGCTGNLGRGRPLLIRLCQIELLSISYALSLGHQDT